MIVLDTHAWLWWVDDPARLSPPARSAIEGEDAIGISAISCWEIGMLVVKKRLAFDAPVRSWVQAALALPGLVTIEPSPRTALEAALLPSGEFPEDPADRLIYATAREHAAALVTRDTRLREYDPRGTIW